ncbi:hypothetical protein C0J52_04803 [Blattella germanica]|nr:hypothetical protein C0J52_04803 [Blattella germanica]
MADDYYKSVCEVFSYKSMQDDHGPQKGKFFSSNNVLHTDLITPKLFRCNKMLEEDSSSLMNPLDENVSKHRDNSLASSGEDSTKKDPHMKFNEHDKPHYNPKHFDYGKHHVVLTAKWTKDEDKPYHWSPPEKIEYVFDQLHFHWGTNDRSGSEHTLNNERFALEMHAVHHRRDYKTLEHAGHYPEGIRVIGVFFRAEEFRNLADHNGQLMKLNWRPTQPLNGRVVWQIR